jgi:tetratricopeptide (TPR) repeat protein
MAHQSDQDGDTLTALWETAIAAGDQARRQGRLTEAARQYETALQTAEQWSAADERLVTSLWRLGEIHHAQKQHAEGEQLRRRALALQETRLGPNAPQVAELLRSLAYDCSNMRKPLEGVSLMEQAQAIYERAVGPEHEEVAQCPIG